MGVEQVKLEMKLREIETLPPFLTEKLVEKGIEELNPPQQQAVEKGVLDGKSMIVSSPTASGKTLIATMAISQVLERGKKALYLVPLKALASEKYQDFKELFGDRYNVEMSVGDRDTSGARLASKDLVVMTVEKLDAVLRHGPTWIMDVDLVVEDEIHLLNSESRGPTLEVTLTRLQELMEFQLLGLSATISNSQAMADWLDAELVESDYRPVELKQGIYWQDMVEFYNNPDEVTSPKQQQNGVVFKTGKEKLEEEQKDEELETEELAIPGKHSRATLNLLDHTIDQGHQAITFVNSRKSAEAEAERGGKVAKGFLDREEKKQLEDLADDVKNVLGSPTDQCRRLAKCVKNGTAFHHAGLLSRQRHMIEDAFRDGLIRSVSATPTLAAGVSLPAYRIIMRDVKRYTNSGLNFIPVLEYEQMTGRAGRPEHHSEGEAITVAKNSGMKEEIRDRYILGEAENIYSKLAVEPVLRMHALSLIATRFVKDFDELQSFFSKTFYAYQYGDISKIRDKLEDVVRKLEEYEFITTENDTLRPTKLGKRIAELYIDPETAYHLIECMERMDEDVKSVAVLQAVTDTVEMRPLFRVKDSELADIEDMLQTVEDRLLTEVPEPWGPKYDTFLESFKTALMLQSWIEEVEEDEMMDRFGVTPGGIRAKVENADWILYAAEEIANLKGWDDARDEMRKMRTRVKHGIGEELVRLVRFKGIGRVRARRLYRNGIETTSDIRDVGFTKLKKLIGKKTAKKLKEQVGQENVFDRENILDYMQ